MAILVDGDSGVIPETAGQKLGDVINAAVTWADERGRVVESVSIDGKRLNDAQARRREGQPVKPEQRIEFITRSRKDKARELLQQYVARLTEIPALAAAAQTELAAGNAHAARETIMRCQESWSLVTGGVQVNVLPMLRVDLRKFTVNAKPGIRIYRAVTDQLIEARKALNRGEMARVVEIHAALVQDGLDGWRALLDALLT
ncbi:MAG: hypothetical protein AB2A00_41100 [Myxococcota bacterium]